MVNDFRAIFDAIRTETTVRKPTKSDGLEGLKEAVKGRDREPRIRRVSAWVFEVNKTADLRDYYERPLRDLLEAVCLARAEREMYYKFLAGINGAKLR